MSNVIKARATRLLPREEDLPHSGADEADEIAESGEAAETRNELSAYQAAYDEVIEAAQEEVALLLEDARRQAREITLEATKKSEIEWENARREGFEEGLTSGYAEGFAKAGQELEDLLQKGQTEVEGVLATAHAAYDDMLAGMEPKIYRLALDIAEKILGYELNHNSEAFLAIVRTALGVMQAESRVTLRVNTQEFINVFHSKDTARIKTDSGGVEADISIDAGIDPYGCLVVTDNGTVDASPSAQIEQIAMNMGISQ